VSGKYALIIGNTEYIDPGLAQLTAPGKDAEDFARVLKDQDICAFDEVNVLLNQPESVVSEAIDEFFDQKKPSDLLILYFSGHGVRDELGALYLAVKNTNRFRLRSTAIKSDYIREVMDQSRSKRQVLILDCCNSGAFAQGTKAAIGVSIGTASAFEGGYGRVILTASDSTQFAWEGNKVIGDIDNSLFTHFLVEGLEGEADLDSDSLITVDELYDYAYEKVILATPKQTPSKFSSKQQGEIVLRKITRIEDIRPLPLPSELISVIENPLPYVREAAVRQLEALLKGKNLGLARSAHEALEKISTEDDSLYVRQVAIQVLQKADEERTAQEEIERLKAEQKVEEELVAQTEYETERLSKENRFTEEKKEEEYFAKAKIEVEPTAEKRKHREEIVQQTIDKVIKTAKPSSLRLGIIGISIVVLALFGYGTTRFLSGIFGAPAITETAPTEALVTSSPPTPTEIVQTNTPNVPTISPTSISYPQEITDGKNVEMVLIPAGEFTMGSDNENQDEKPARRVYLDNFYIDKFEVTNLLYKGCVDAEACEPPKRNDSYTHIYYHGSATFGYYPVIYVDWQMAQSFCQWRDARLPSEAEWEKAARGLDERIYPWGNSIDCSFASYGGTEKGCVKDTSRIGSYEAGKSFYGIYDMAGNVWEWTSSLYRPYPYSATDGREDLSTSGNRVMRGGAWNVDDSIVRSSHRYQYNQASFDGVIGFRCAQSP
jgi:formylglycine-generating enzyme required for sulfatase activity